MPGSLPFESAHLLKRCEAGDSSAEQALFKRYVARLTLLARSRLSRRLASRVDPEDVVLSAYRSFFVAARHQHFDLQRSGDLWRLLVQITLAKVYDQAERHHAQRRDVRREVPAEDGTTASAGWLPAIARDPSPAEVAQAIDELERLLAALPEIGGQILQLRLQGYRQDEIAEQVGCSERTVRRWMERAGSLLKSSASSAEHPQ
ncbi:RNA polymerase sigma factor [Anatilimnocola aggregata]|uniref:RNA polymerase sigma factor n=1 Tax=Anatilimnocola aggregata TaxID=2528021 RepID=A0A517YCY1_9BACT|nr:sigma-70 family RNA polymerase sigma factor [Anatilimnocola aggregata]QDU28091.1 RNA polymerase sigma factor [Anatilimnocola aggregata]